MKKRRTLIISLLLIAALALGIGYAGVSTQLKIIGTATSDQQAINVQFTNGSIVSTNSTEDTVEAAILANSKHGYTAPTTEIKPLVKGLTHEGDSIVFEYTITNNNDYAVTLVKPNIRQASDTVLTVTTDFGDNDVELAKGATKTIQVTVELSTVNADPITEDFTVSIEAKAGNQGIST